MIELSKYIREYLRITTGTEFTIPAYLEVLPPAATGDFILVEGGVSSYYSQMLNCSEWDMQIKTQSNISKEKSKEYSISVLEQLGDITDLNITLDSETIRLVKSKAYAPLLYLGEAKKNFFQYSNRFRVLIQNLGI